MSAPTVALLGFVGAKGSGKDTAASFLADLGFVRVAIADPLRVAAQALFALPDEYTVGDKKEKAGPLGISYREGMQLLGTDFLRDLLPQRLPQRILHASPLTALLRETVRAHLEQGRKVAVTDVRFADEAATILELGGRLVLVERDAGQLRDFYAEMGWDASDKHPSETGVRDIFEKYGGTDHAAVAENRGSLEDFRTEVLRALCARQG